MIGYIVKSGNSYLTKDRFWYPHDRDKDAYVFSDAELNEIRQDAPLWQDKPEWLIPAEYKSGAVIIIGIPMLFEEPTR